MALLLGNFILIMISMTLFQGNSGHVSTHFFLIRVGDTYFYIAHCFFESFVKVYTFFYYTFLIHKMSASLKLLPK